MGQLFNFLILEDNPIDAELIQFELAEGGFAFNAKVVVTEQDFVRELKEESPDLILSDYHLPRYDGVRALAETKRNCPDTPFILVTGALSEDRAIDIFVQGAKDYVLKTLLHKRLVPAVRRALSEAAEHRARKRAEEELREAHRTLEERVKERTAELEAEIARRKKTEAALEGERRQLAQALEEVRTLRGILPICANCKNIRDDKGYWSQVEKYISDHTEARFSHGICPDCMAKFYPDYLSKEP
jgi:two-component system OmpR family sensor kinase